jgi:predicted ATP-dependent Lon-type protease
MKDIPDGFIISRYYLDPAYAKEELAVALSIAMGHHGFGEKFTKENPFIIAPIEKFKTKRSGISMEELQADAMEVARQYGDRVIIRGFREPEIKNL